MSKIIPHFFAILFVLISGSIAKSQMLRDSNFENVIWVVLENTNMSNALRQPFLKELTERGALLKHMIGEAHPSQPNYIAMLAGDTMGVWSDGKVNIAGQNLVDLLESHGRSWKAYAEGFPGNCFLGKTKKKYARKHVPFLSFTNISADANRCAHVVEAAQFDQDLKNGNLPNFSMYTPDLNNDGHDTNVTYADKFLAQKFGDMIRNPELMQDTIFILTFDESALFFSNDIYTVIVGGKIQPGSSSTQKLNHISLLHMIEEEWQLGSLNRKDRSAVSPQGIWQP